jgi:hypothetical protein
MGIVKLKNLPGLHLNDLLRRKKATLHQFISDFGISTYEGLKARCERIGVISPTIEQFEEVMPKLVNSPTEGVVVLDPPPVVHEHTGKIIEDVASSSNLLVKKNKKKKVVAEEAGDDVIHDKPMNLEEDTFSADLITDEQESANELDEY